MRVLVHGAGGLLGHDLLPELTAAGFDVDGSDIEQADICDSGALRALFAEKKPDVVVNLAAYTDVDGCESNEDQAFRVNALGARNMAVCCEESGAQLVHISTDYVFDGASGRPYRELDTANPISVYGASKLEGEWYVSRFCRRFAIVRTSWLFGRHGKSFPAFILENAGRSESLTIVDDQVGSPTYTVHLARGLTRLIGSGSLGIYHMTARGRCSWFDFARRIVERAGIVNCEIKPITTSQLGRPAPRPAFSVLDNRNLRLEGLDLLPGWEQGLEDYLKEG